MKKILAEISLGELADKITILEIKMEKIINKESLNTIKKEYQSLKSINIEIVNLEKYKQLFNDLKLINEKLWNIENEKRLCEKNADFGEVFIKTSRDIHFLNDERGKIKLEMNNHSGSKIREIKEYTSY